MITLNNISVSYGDNVVYKNFSFNFPAGVNVVIGKSGCGKTTLINVVANLVEFEGSCLTDGSAQGNVQNEQGAARDVTDARVARGKNGAQGSAANNVSIVFQQPCLAPVSVWKNIDLVLQKGADAQRVQRAMELAQIAHKKDVNAQKLSGGEQQRVALARAFAVNRPVMLMDEPFEGLDYGTKKQLQKVLCEMIRQSDVTALIVTHDIDEALALADRIYLLHEKPCRLDLAETVETPREARDEFSEQTLRQKARLQELLM